MLPEEFFVLLGAINNQRYACHENQNPIKLPSRNDSDSLKNRHHSVTGSDACFAGPGARCASPGGSFGGTPGARSCLAAGDVSLHARNGLPAIGSCCSSSSRLLHRALMVRATVRFKVLFI